MLPLTTPQHVTDLGEGIYGFRAIAEIAARLVSTDETIFFPLVNLVLIHDSPIFKFVLVCCLSIFRKPHMQHHHMCDAWCCQSSQFGPIVSSPDKRTLGTLDYCANDFLNSWAWFKIGYPTN
jgi:hypothetical protein